MSLSHPEMQNRIHLSLQHFGVPLLHVFLRIHLNTGCLTIRLNHKANPGMSSKNIARGTTDPEIHSVTWIKFDNNMALIANLAT